VLVPRKPTGIELDAGLRDHDHRPGVGVCNQDYEVPVVLKVVTAGGMGAWARNALNDPN
jgi:hypothetical protein